MLRQSFQVRVPISTLAIIPVPSTLSQPKTHIMGHPADPTNAATTDQPQPRKLATNHHPGTTNRTMSLQPQPTRSHPSRSAMQGIQKDKGMIIDLTPDGTSISHAGITPPAKV